MMMKLALVPAATAPAPGADVAAAADTEAAKKAPVNKPEAEKPQTKKKQQPANRAAMKKPPAKKPQAKKKCGHHKSRQKHWSNEELDKLDRLVQEQGGFDCARLIREGHFPGRTRSALKGAYDRPRSRYAGRPSQHAAPPPAPPLAPPPSAPPSAVEEQQLLRLLEDEDFNGWMDEDWKMQAEEELRAGVDALTSVDDSAQECHIASMRNFAMALLDRGVIKPDSPRRTRRGRVY